MALSVTACNTNKTGGQSRSGEKITEDSPWFNTRSFEVGLELDADKKVNRVSQKLIGFEDDKYIVFASGSYMYPDEEFIDWDAYNQNDFDIEIVQVVDRASGDTILTMDLTQGLDTNTHIYGAEYNDGTITAYYGSYVEEREDFIYYAADYDLATGEVTGTREFDGYDDYICDPFCIGDYVINIESIWDEKIHDAHYCLHITSPDGSTNKLELTPEGTTEYDVLSILAKDASTAILPADTDNGMVYYELNLETLTLSDANSAEYEWLGDLEVEFPFTGSDGKSYCLNNTGISTIDFNGKTITEYFNYSWCNIGRSTLTNMSPVSVNGDTFVMCGDDVSHNNFTDSYETHFTIVEFTKADKNPHAGKSVLELYSANGYIDTAVSDAIVRFNESSSTCYIEVTDRYDIEVDYESFDIRSDDDYAAFKLETDSNLSSRLAMDIMNGDGPDILINASSFGQLNSNNYLADLSPYVGDLDPDKYFTNVIDSARIDGKLYNVPVCFSIEGILTDSENAGSSGVGFTIEEYEEFCSTTLNGQDIITYGQANYFVKLFNSMSEKFISDGKADFTGPEFEELASYVKDNVTDKAVNWADLYDDDYDPDLMRNRDAELISCAGCYQYMINIAEMTGSSDILGLPSADGRGPSVCSGLSVAVSSHAYDPDACGEFVKTFLSDDIQNNLAMEDQLVLSRAAFRTSAEAAVEYMNGDGYYQWFGHAGEDPNSQRLVFSNEVIDGLENIILSCSRMNVADASIDKILIEEMPAYFTGQKELGDVITIAQDRVQKVLDERN